METDTRKNLRNELVVLPGGRAYVRPTHAERDVERAVRALVYAMAGKDRNLRNVASGRTSPVRMLVRRFKEAKRARRDRVNYPLCKEAVRELDRFVDALFGMHDDRPKAA